MTATVADLVALVERLAPRELASEWDNVGLLVGRRSRHVTRVLVALDLREQVVAAGMQRGCDAVLVHHPPIFPNLASVTDAPGAERAVLTAAEAGIAVVAAHTNLDATSGGLNDIMGELLGITPSSPLEPAAGDPTVGLGRIGAADGLRVADLVARAASAFDAHVRFTGDPTRALARVAWCTGSGGSLIGAARAAGADAYVTGDLRYHDHDQAPDLVLVDVPHAAVEARCLALWSERVLVPAATAAGIEVVPHSSSTDPWRA